MGGPWWPDPDPGIPKHRSVLCPIHRLACVVRHKAPLACPAPSSSFHQCASSSSVTREPCRHLSSSRAASPSRQVRSCFSNSPNSLRFSRSSCLRNQPAVESALSATPWCIRRSEKVRRECTWSHPFHSLTTFSRNPKSRSGKVGQGCILAHRCSGHDQTLGRVRA